MWKRNWRRIEGLEIWIRRRWNKISNENILQKRKTRREEHYCGYKDKNGKQKGTAEEERRKSVEKIEAPG